MKKTTILLALLLLTSLFSFAQNGFLQKKKEQIKSLKIGYITEELNLTADEATKFWPLFNAFEDKQQEIRQQRLKNYLNRLDSETATLSEKDAQNLLNQIENTEEEIFLNRKKFIVNLKTVLPASKILKLKKVEAQFSKRLLQQYRNQKE